MRMIIAERCEKGGGMPVPDIGVSGMSMIQSDRENNEDTLETAVPLLAETLSAYGILISPPGAEEEIIARLPMSDMMVPSSLQPFVNTYASELKASDVDVAGSYFFGNLTGLVLGQQRLASQFGASADFSPDNISAVMMRDSAGYARIFFVLTDPRLKREPAFAAREDWLREHYARLHGETLKPLADSWAAATGLRAGYLWGVMPTRFNYGIEQQEREAAGNEGLLHRIQGDARLLKEMDRTVFGLPRNPFDVKIRWIEHIADSDQQVRMKNVCCLYYKTDGGNYCYTCPKSSESERACKRAEYRAKQNG